MAGAADFAKMVPGFEFLQGLMQNATNATLPGMGQWIAPTLDPEALGKRIDELRTVQFWLEQNTRMIAATIQAMEVQRMTLSTLKTMNTPVADIANAFMIKPAADTTLAPTAEPSPAPEPTPAWPSPAPAKPAPKPVRKPPPKAAAPAAPGVVDPMQWWGALTQQFSQLAANALADVNAAAPKPAADEASPQKPVAATKTAQKKARGAGAPSRRR
jgi:hypothetical protein